MGVAVEIETRVVVMIEGGAVEMEVSRAVVVVVESRQEVEEEEGEVWKVVSGAAGAEVSVERVFETVAAKLLVSLEDAGAASVSVGTALEKMLVAVLLLSSVETGVEDVGDETAFERLVVLLLSSVDMLDSVVSGPADDTLTSLVGTEGSETVTLTVFSSAGASVVSGCGSCVVTVW